MADSAKRERVVVGVDGSEPSARALAWAVAEAVRRQAPLHVVHAWIWPLFKVPLGAPPAAPEGAGLQAEAEAVLAEAVAAVREQAPDLTVTTDLVVGGASPVLIAESGDAQLVVVGCRGLGGFAGLLLGSVGVHLAAHAHCPVAVVRGDAAPDGPVVVGVDGSECSRLAAQAAFESAHYHRAPLTVVHAHPLPGRGPHLFHRHEGAGHDVEREGQEVIGSIVGDLVGDHPDVPVTRLVREGPANRELLDVARGARLLVVGSKGRGGIASFRLGSTSHAAIHHSTCPVLVCRGVGAPAPAGGRG